MISASAKRYTVFRSWTILFTMPTHHQITCFFIWTILGCTYAGLPVLFDDFEDGSTQGWRKGMAVVSPVNQAGGPAGPLDRYLQYASTGGGGQGSKMVFFNQGNWAGNFLAGGYSYIACDVRNLSAAETLYLRITFEGSSSWSSTTAIEVPPNGTWQHLVFDIRETAMSPLGAGSYASVLSNLQKVRILSAQATPDSHGDAIVATIGIDNIQALTSLPPVPPRFSLIRFDEPTETLTLRWDSEAAGVYDLLYSNDAAGTFNPAGWLVLTNGLPATGVSTELTLPDFQGQAWSAAAPWWAFRLRTQ
ncbi:MAG: hypothetical protein ACI97B_001665 [Verrucomicrobiales bacterium]|jgi:hypothetical protein